MSSSPITCLASRHDGEPHRSHQAHLVDLFSHMNFHFVAAGFPCALWGREREIAAVVFERNVHRILSNHDGGIETDYGFREAAPKHLEPLIMLVKMEHDKDAGSVGLEPVGRFHRHNFMRTVKAQLFVESFRRCNSLK